MHHFRRQNLEGARKLYSGHRRLLAGYLPEHQGVDVEQFLGEMQRCLRPLFLPEGPALYDAARRPRIRRVVS